MKKIVTVILIILVALFVFSVARDMVIKGFVVSGIKKATGTNVTIGNLSLSLLTQSVKINNFRMYNPPDFPKGILMDLPYIKVSFDALALLKNELHLKELTIELKELQLIKNKEKEFNVDALKVSKGKEPSTKRKQTMRIDVLNLNIGRIIQKDYSGAGEPVIQVNDLNIKKTYKNITSIEQLIMLILSESMKLAGIKGAKLYGLFLLTGVGIVPVAVATTFLGKDSVDSSFNYSVGKVYDEALKIIAKSGIVKKASKESGFISANVDGADVNLEFSEIGNNKTRVKASARKYFFPKPQIASGIIYQISEVLK